MCSGNTITANDVNCGAAGKILKTTPALIVADRMKTCCDDTCGGVTCDAGGHLKASAASIRSTDTRAGGNCCDHDITGRCSGNTNSANDFSCPANYILKAGSSSITGNSACACCDNACSGVTCLTGTVLRANAVSIAGTTTAQCCITPITGRCSGNTNSANDVSCGANKILKANSNSITGNTEATCCDDACSGLTCVSGSQLKANAASIRGTSTAAGGLCCDSDITGRCSGNTNGVDFSCGANKILKANSNSITGNTATACCDDVCSGVVCAAGGYLKSNAATIRSTDTTAGGTCCNQKLCQCNDAQADDYTCTGGGTYRFNAMSTFGYTESTCCTSRTGYCSGNTLAGADVNCGAHKILKANSNSITGNTVTACCDDVCSGVTCVSGSHLKANAANIRGTSTAAGGVCCDSDIAGRCSGNTNSANDVSCPANHILKAGSSSITGNTACACCDQACIVYACPLGSHLKDNAASIRGSSNAACCESDITNLCTGNTHSHDDVDCATECYGTYGCMAQQNLVAGTTKGSNACESCCTPAPRDAGGSGGGGSGGDGSGGGGSGGDGSGATADCRKQSAVFPAPMVALALVLISGM